MANEETDITERQARWAKAEKERGPKNGEIVRDKFPQAFKEWVLNRGKELEKSPAAPNDSTGIESSS